MGINRDLNPTGHTEWQCKVVHLSERCPIYNRQWWNTAKAYICFNSVEHGILWRDDLEWCDWWMILPQWDRELARHVEKSSEAGSGHPLRTCTAKMKGCLVLERQHQTATSSCILSPIPHSPSISLSDSWLSPQYDIVLLLHVYPVAIVTQCLRCHSKITQGGIHRSPEFSSPPIYVFSLLQFDLFVSLPCSSVWIQIIHNIIDYRRVTSLHSEKHCCT